MSRGAPLPPGVSLSPAAQDEAPLLANLLELYAHDFSELIELELGGDGRFGYPRLPLYWSEPDHLPFLVRVEGRPAGFVMLVRGSRLTGDGEVWDVEEFFVARRHRRRGLGVAVAHEVWRRFPGRWEVRVMEVNRAAIEFWAAAIAAFLGRSVEPETLEADERWWQVFAFDAPGGDESMEMENG